MFDFRLRWFVVAALAVVALPAQIEVVLLDDDTELEQLWVGERAPEVEFGRWLRGDPVARQRDEAPAATIYAFYPDRATLAADGDYLADLQRRFLARGACVVAVVPTADFEVPEHLGAVHVALDAGGEIAAAWISGGWHGRLNLIVVDRGRTVTFRGRPGHGALDAVERTLDAELDVEIEHKIGESRQMLGGEWDSILGPRAMAMVDTILEHAPRDGYALALAYLAASTKLLDESRAEQIRELAVGRLANEARPLAVFADLALRGEPTNSELARQLAAALVPAMAGAPRDLVVQLAYLRALVYAGMDRQVGRQAMMIKQLAFERGWTTFELAEILTHDRQPQVHAVLCEQALQRLEQIGFDDRLRQALRYTVARRSAEDDEAAQGCLEAYVGGLGLDGDSVNNDCWYFMTELPTMGRLDVFAVALADKMLEDSDDLDAYKLDTVALAKFLAGQFGEAVTLQQAALDVAPGNNDYAERLQRYRAALAGAAAADPARDRKK